MFKCSDEMPEIDVVPFKGEASDDRDVFEAEEVSSGDKKACTWEELPDVYVAASPKDVSEQKRAALYLHWDAAHRDFVCVCVSVPDSEHPAGAGAGAGGGAGKAGGQAEGRRGGAKEGGGEAAGRLIENGDA